MTNPCPCPECSAFGRDTHADPLTSHGALPDPYDWFHEYEPEGPHFNSAFGCLLGLIALVPLLTIIAWQSLRARWQR